MQAMQLLIVDHDLGSLDTLGSALTNAGYHVTALNSDDLALAVLEKKHFDLVIADTFAEKMAGIRFLQELKRMSPDTMVILMTPEADLDATVSAVRLGADDYFVKPCSPELICASVTRCFDKIERRKKAKNAVRQAFHQKDVRFQNLVDMLDEGYFETNAHGDPVFVNAHLSRMLGYSKKELVTMKTLDFMENKYADMFFSLLFDIGRTKRPAKLIGMEFVRKDQTISMVDLLASPLPALSADTGGIRVMVKENAEREQANEQMSYAVYRDALTGLKNRKALFERLDEWLVYTKRYKTGIALLLITIENLQQVNMQYGHATGDMVIKEIADRLRGELRRSDLIFRLGGEEFAVLLTNPEHGVPNSAADRIQGRLAMPYTVADNDIDFLKANIGISVSSEKDTDKIQLLYNADKSMQGEAVRADGFAAPATVNIRAHRTRL